jgi:hypothetical protein
MADGSPIDKQLQQYFQDELGLDLSEEDLLEIRESLFYLGRAIERYHHLKQGSGDGK